MWSLTAGGQDPFLVLAVVFPFSETHCSEIGGGSSSGGEVLRFDIPGGVGLLFWVKEQHRWAGSTVSSPA